MAQTQPVFLQGFGNRFVGKFAVNRALFGKLPTLLEHNGVFYTAIDNPHMGCPLYVEVSIASVSEDDRLTASIREVPEG